MLIIIWLTTHFIYYYYDSIIFLKHFQEISNWINLIFIGLITHMSIFVQLIVGEFQFVKGHYLFHPIGAGSRWVGMHVDPGRGDGIRLASHHPTGAKKNNIIIFITY